MAHIASATRPRWWPHFSSTIRSTALTARLGAMLGSAVGICFLTGLLSYYQYQPWSWLPQPAGPVWGYRLTQGIHVATGMAAIPLLFMKLWSVYPNHFRWPPLRSIKHAVERFTVVILVGSALVQMITGFCNILNWYPFRWDFLSVHYYLAYVVVGSVLLHIGVKLPDIVYGLQTKVAEGDVLTEIPSGAQAPTGEVCFCWTWYDAPVAPSGLSFGFNRWSRAGRSTVLRCSVHNYPGPCSPRI